MALYAYIDLADEFRKMMRKGTHPMGKTLKQLMMEKVKTRNPQTLNPES